MKLECEKIPECVATPELIRELVRDGIRRGDYMIMFHDDDDGAFVQIACDHGQAGGNDDGCFDLEYREGREGKLFHCKSRVSANAAEGIFLDELNGLSSWRSRYEWEDWSDVVGGKSLASINKVVVVVAIAILAFAVCKFALKLF